MGDFPKSLENTVIFANHSSCTEYMDFIEDYLDDELAAGRMSGPFTQEEAKKILGHFQSSPLTVSIQPQGPGEPDKLRLCRNLSKSSKLHLSTNDYIDTDDFPTRFGSAAEVAEIISSAPEGTQAMTLDIAKFHRTCPICPAHKHMFVVQSSRGFWIDHDCPFGCRSSESNAGSIANGALDIWREEGVGPSVKWVDDLTVFRYALGRGSAGDFLYPYDRAEALRRIAPLAIPWHPDKGQDFDSSFTYIGFFWDIAQKRVSLPEKKRLKFLARIKSFLSSYRAQQCPLSVLMTIQGSLCHIVFVYPLGQSRLPNLFSFIASFQDNQFIKRWPPRSLLSDLGWWEEELRKPDVFRSLQPRGPGTDLGIFVDASTSWGIGVVWGSGWDAWKTKDGWRGPSRDIVWLENIAVELVVYMLDERGIRNSNVIMHSDNQGVIGAFGKGRSSNFECNLSIRRASAVLAARNVTPLLQYIESEKNPADPISRGELGSSANRIHSQFQLPEELHHFFIHV